MLLHRSPWLRAICYLPFLLTPGVGAAQQANQSGAIGGVVLDAATEVPVAHALLSLIGPVASPPLQETLSDSVGRFVFAGLVPDTYRVRVHRPGYTAELSHAAIVQPGDTTHIQVVSSPAPIRLSGLTARAGECYTADRLDEAPDIAALWREASNTFRLETEMLRRFRYRFHAREITSLRVVKGQSRTTRDTLVTVGGPNGADAWSFVGDPLRNESDLTEIQGMLQQLHGSAEQRIDLRSTRPDMLLNAEFLQQSCLENDNLEKDGILGLRFRPAQRTPRGVKGTLWFDARTTALHTVMLQSFTDDHAGASTLVWRFGDVPLPGGQVRLVTHAQWLPHFPGAVGKMIGLNFEVSRSLFQDFERVEGF